MFFTVTSFSPAFSGKIAGNYWRIKNLVVDLSTPSGANFGGSAFFFYEGGTYLMANNGNFVGNTWTFDEVGVAEVDHRCSGTISHAAENGGPFNMFDSGVNYLTSEWQYNGSLVNGGGWTMTLDFSARGPQVIDGFAYGGAADAQRKWPTQFDVEVSDDGSTWTAVVTLSGITDPGDGVLSSIYPIQ
jgi:hypothetical protein